MHKILKTAYGDNAVWKHRFLIDFLNFKCRETFVEACEHSRYPYTGYFECKCIKNLFLQTKWITKITTGRFCNIWGATPPRAARTLAETQLVHTPQQCTSIPHQCWNFCLLNKQLWSPTLLNHLIWTHVPSFCFWEWNQRYDGTVSMMSLKFRNNCWTCYIWISFLAVQVIFICVYITNYLHFSLCF